MTEGQMLHEHRERKRRSIYNKIEVERRKQIDRYGEPEDNSPLWWTNILMQELGQASSFAFDLILRGRGIFPDFNHWDLQFRNALYKIAAVAVAAIENVETSDVGDKIREKHDE